MYTEGQTKDARRILKKGLGILVNAHTLRKELSDSEIKLMDELSALSVSFTMHIEDRDMDTLSGLQYLYDKHFKGDKDFYPTDKVVIKLLNLEK